MHFITFYIRKKTQLISDVKYKYMNPGGFHFLNSSIDKLFHYYMQWFKHRGFRAYMFRSKIVFQTCFDGPCGGRVSSFVECAKHPKRGHTGWDESCVTQLFSVVRKLFGGWSKLCCINKWIVIFCVKNYIPLWNLNFN